ncbi:conjugal transfer protein TraF [Noviherbaspirillum sp. ST9]|uniref:conjugal transfer protein TraF n=1 Tax=Noviherbaspirillum sp. ST9 TaxID=3401606 RepID=UPI003B587657
MKIVVALAITACMITAHAQIRMPTAVAPERNSSYWSDSQRGWHFYEDPEAELEQPPLPKAEPRKAGLRKPPEIAAFERLQKTLEETRNIAIIHPTETNVRRYMELEARVVNQASLFADVAQRVAWATPTLDPTLHGRPVNAKALQVFEQTQLESRSHSVAELAKDHVLFFFFRSDCPYCHAFAPTLTAFQARHGITIVAISVDGGGIPGFAAPRRDNGIARTLNVTQVPAVFLAQPFTGKIAPIGFGVLSESQLLERINTLSAQQPEAMPPRATTPISLHDSPH